jgi:hypothetical protein
MTSSFDNDNYSFEQKKRIASKISEVRDKTVLRQIKNIIFEENPDAVAKKSSGGYLMFFQNYVTNTYVRLEALLSKIELDRLARQTKSIALVSETLICSDDPSNDYETSRSRLRYSNREKRLIKRQQYETLITKQNTEHLTESSPLTDYEQDSDENIEESKQVITVTKSTKVKKCLPEQTTKTSALPDVEVLAKAKNTSKLSSNIFTKVK